MKKSTKKTTVKPVELTTRMPWQNSDGSVPPGIYYEAVLRQAGDRVIDLIAAAK